MMPRFLMVFPLILLHTCALAQLSDIITVRKSNGRTIRTFTRGSSITFIDPSSSVVSGRINDIRNDSVFLIQLDIRSYRTNTGAQLTDTIAAWINGWHYKELLKIKVYDRSNRALNLAGSAMMIGGAGYAVLNVVNGAYLDQPITDPDNMKTLGIALGTFGLGFALKKLFPPNQFSRPKHQITYIRMN